MIADHDAPARLCNPGAHGPNPWRSYAREKPSSVGTIGFTLAELLIVASIGMVLIAALVLMVLSYTRSRERIEALTRLQDHWSRVQFLLDQEIQESRVTTIASVSVPVSCPAAASSSAVLVLKNSDFSAPILYYLSGATLRRCGPAIDANGQLTASVSDQLVLRNVSAMSIDLSDSERPRYNLTLTDSSGYSYTNQSQPSGSISRVRPI